MKRLAVLLILLVVCLLWWAGDACAIVDSAFADADGDLVEMEGSHEADSADWQHVNETTANDTDYLIAQGVGVNWTTFVDLNVDTIFATFDSLRIIVRGMQTRSTGTRDVKIMYDTSGTDVDLDTATYTTSFATYVSRPITGLSKVNLDGLEIGVYNIDASFFGEAIHTSWLFAEIYTTEAAGGNIITLLLRRPMRGVGRGIGR